MMIRRKRAIGSIAEEVITIAEIDDKKKAAPHEQSPKSGFFSFYVKLPGSLLFDTVTFRTEKVSLGRFLSVLFFSLTLRQITTSSDVLSTGLTQNKESVYLFIESVEMKSN